MRSVKHFLVLVSLVFLGLFVVSGSFGASFGDIQDSVNSASNSGGTVNLGSGTYYGLVEDKIVVDNKTNLVIRGTSSSNMATIDGQDVSRAFVLSNDSSVTFRYIQFVNCGGSSVSGSAISSKGKVAIENCIFEDNTGESGGAIFLSENADYSVISDCQFIGNKGKYEGADGWVEGGAIDIHASSVTIKNTIFRNNLAVDVGGAVNFASSTMGHKLVNCSFSGNSAPSGGAIRSVASSLTMEACVFTNNKATINGGAIYSSSSNIVIKGCSFTSNSAGNFGGALYLIGSDVVNIGSSSNFESNKAKNGGAIYSTSPMTISSSTFKNNQATSNGGAIYITSSRSTITSSKFTSNAAKFGGAIYNNAPLSISSSDFKYNKASSYGGAIYANNNLNISGGSIKSNNASYGSGVYNLATLRLSKITISDNIAKVLSISLKAPSSVKPSKKLNIAVSLKTGDNIAGAIYNKKGSTYINGSKKAISANTPSKTFSSKIGGKSKNIRSNFDGLATRTYIVSKNAKSNIVVLVSYSQGGKKWSITKSIKVSSTAKAVVKTVVKTKPISSKTSSSTPSIKNGVNVKVSFSGHIYSHLASLVNMSDYKVDSTNISYWNLKTNKSLIAVTDYLYKVDKTGWYYGVVSSKGEDVSWKKLGAKPTTSGTWFNLSLNFEKKTYIIGKMIPKYTNNTSDESIMFFVSVQTTISHEIYTPYIKYTYCLLNKNGKTKKVSFFEKTDTDIYFKSSLSSNQLKKYANYLKSTPNCPNNNKDIKNQIIKIFGTSLKGEITSYDKSIVIFNWVKQKEKYDLHYDTWYSAPVSLYRILNVKYPTMNCADHSHLVNAMLRTVGIPAIYGNGLSKFSSGSWRHYWSMAYIGTKWVYLDAIHSYFKYDDPPWKLDRSDSRYGSYYSVSGTKISAGIKLR